MRFTLAVMAVVVGMSLSGLAQSQPNQFKVKSSKADAEPKSTAPPAKAPGGTATSATSKELKSVERENAKGGGAAHTAKRTPRPAAIKEGKEDKNPPMNFGGQGGQKGGLTKQPSPYKGRLKQKGQGAHS
ncbi:MAG: hypothetical protein ABSD39_21570 [Terriglobales bacterium]|jgi:hypothetical protein